MSRWARSSRSRPTCGSSPRRTRIWANWCARACSARTSSIAFTSFVWRCPACATAARTFPLLVEHFVAKFNRLQGKDVVGVSDEVLARLMEHDYPGNVRELENIIEHAFVLCRGGLIQLAHLPPELRGSAAGEAAPSIAGMTLEAMERLLITDALRRHHGNRTAAAKHLGINPSTLFRKAKTLGIELPKEDGRKK